MTAPAHGPDIRRLLLLSTAHLPAHLGTDGLPDVANAVADPWELGFTMWVPEDPADYFTERVDGDDLAPGTDAYTDAETVRAIQVFARSHGCDFVRFDVDALRLNDDDLPSWDW